MNDFLLEFPQLLSSRQVRYQPPIPKRLTFPSQQVFGRNTRLYGAYTFESKYTKELNEKLVLWENAIRSAARTLTDQIKSAMFEANKALPALVVLVQDMQNGISKRVRVQERADA